MDNTATTKKNGSAAPAGSKSNASSTTPPSSSRNWLWTNERHTHFLNSIEASFVRAMLQNHRVGGGGGPPSLRLDRQLPDSLESTLDLGKERPRRHSTSDVVEYSSGRTDKKIKRLPSHHYDQVVPQIEMCISGSKEDDDPIAKRGRP